MNSPVKQRLILFLFYLKIGQKRFALNCGLSAGFVNSIVKSIQPDTLHKISMQYPELNTGWLLTGEGSMLKYGSPEDAENSQVVIVPHKAKYKNIKSVKIYNANATMGISLVETYGCC